MQRDFGATAGVLNRFDGVITFALRFPANSVFAAKPGAARDQRNAVRDDERGIETHAELADQIGVLGLVAREPAKELARAGLGDGADIVDHLLSRHADPVIRNGESPRDPVESNADL